MGMPGGTTSCSTAVSANVQHCNLWTTSASCTAYNSCLTNNSEHFKVTTFGYTYCTNTPLLEDLELFYYYVFLAKATSHSTN